MLGTARELRAIGVTLAILVAGLVVSDPLVVEYSALQRGSKREAVVEKVDDASAAMPLGVECDLDRPAPGSGAAVASPSDSLACRFLDREVQVSGISRPFVVYLPLDYSPSRAWPAILFLHGKGESGNDGRRQLTQGLAPEIMKRPGDWPFVVIFPQKSKPETGWVHETPMLAAILEAVEANFHLDPSRRYITGLSQGGHGALVLATRLPWRFAALASICGWVDDPAAAVAALGTVPVWAFHGEDDPIVPVQRSLEVVEAIRRVGGEARFTRYASVGHDAWNLAYGNDDLPQWFLSHYREP